MLAINFQNPDTKQIATNLTITLSHEMNQVLKMLDPPSLEMAAEDSEKRWSHPKTIGNAKMKRNKYAKMKMLLQNAIVNFVDLW